MRIGALLSIAYVAAVLSSREWRAIVYHTLFYTPWRLIARSMFDAFPTSSWRGPARLVGVPLAAYFVALMLAVFFLFVIGLEIVFSPKAVYCSLVNLSRRLRHMRTGPPNQTPPAAALAIPIPESFSIVDAISRARIRR